MSSLPGDLDARLARAVRQFWSQRGRQARSQGTGSGERDRGDRRAVTGGRHLDGFRELMAGILAETGLPPETIHWRQRTELPGWYRPEKSWDLLLVVDDRLIAIVEFKSQVGSFGNNFNNRTEEALGNATDLWAAYEQGAFRLSERPWLGFFMLLEDAPGSTRPVRAAEPHFPVFDEFRGASYARRYELMLHKLVRSRLYDAACLILSPKTSGARGVYREPNPELSFRNFAQSLLAPAIAAAMMRDRDRG